MKFVQACVWHLDYLLNGVNRNIIHDNDIQTPPITNFKLEAKTLKIQGSDDNGCGVPYRTAIIGIRAHAP